MDGFKQQKKMDCFKEGGQVGYKSRKTHSETKEESSDIAQDKKIVKKAFKIHDEQKHEGKTDLSKLCGGGRLKTGGKVKRYEAGSKVTKEPMEPTTSSPLGSAQPSGAMGVAAPGRKYQPGRSPEPRVGYCGGGTAKKKGK